MTYSKINTTPIPYNLISLSRGIKRLEKLGTAVTYPDNFQLNIADEVPSDCYIVKSGRVICYETSYAGALRIYNIMEPGSLLMEECLLFDYPCPVVFKTMGKTELVRIDKCDLKRAFKHDIDVVMDVCESLSVKFLSAMEHQRIGARQSASWKICQTLLMFGESKGAAEDGRIVINERLNQNMLSELLGINRVTVTRKLKELKEAGLIDYSHGRYSILDAAALKAYMEKIECK